MKLSASAYFIAGHERTNYEQKNCVSFNCFRLNNVSSLYLREKK